MPTLPQSNRPPRRPLTHSPHVAIANRKRIPTRKVLSGCAVIQDLGDFAAAQVTCTRCRLRGEVVVIRLDPLPTKPTYHGFAEAGGTRYEFLCCAV